MMVLIIYRTVVVILIKLAPKYPPGYMKSYVNKMVSADEVIGSEVKAIFPPSNLDYTY